MVDLFAADDPQADLSYVNVRNPTHDGAARARANCDDLWRDFEPLANAHFLAEFPRRFHQRWFEMYLAVALLRSGLPVQCIDDAAPDILIPGERGNVWIEAIAPTGGDPMNPDRVVHHEPAREGEIPVAFGVPIPQVILRVRAALFDKAKKIATYRARGVIGPNDQALIAINVRDIPHGFFDAERFALGAVYGQGDPYVVIDRRTLKAVEQGIAQRPTIARHSGEQINMEPFLHPGHEHVSGALISGTDAANCSTPLGRDFMLLPNPNASPLYRPGLIRLGREWRLQQSQPGEYAVEVIEHS